MSIATTGNESKEHINAKVRLWHIVVYMGFAPDYEIRTGTTKTDRGDRNYTVDLFAYYIHAKSGQSIKVAFEVEGFKGHNSNRQIARDNNRDKGHLTKNIYTVRIKMKDLVGKKKLDSDTIKEEIIYQLKNQGCEL